MFTLHSTHSPNITDWDGTRSEWGIYPKNPQSEGKVRPAFLFLIRGRYDEILAKRLLENLCDQSCNPLDLSFFCCGKIATDNDYQNLFQRFPDHFYRTPFPHRFCVDTPSGVIGSASSLLRQGRMLGVESRIEEWDIVNTDDEGRRAIFSFKVARHLDALTIVNILDLLNEQSSTSFAQCPFLCQGVIDSKARFKVILKWILDNFVLTEDVFESCYQSYL